MKSFIKPSGIKKKTFLFYDLSAISTPKKYAQKMAPMKVGLLKGQNITIRSLKKKQVKKYA